MDYLRLQFEALGFSNVETFIASGNVIFDSTSKSTPALERRIEGYLLETVGYKVATFIRTPAELAMIASYKAFAAGELNAEGHSLYIGFLAKEPNDESRQKVLSFTSKVDDFHVSGREIYRLCRKKFSESEFSGALLEKTLGMQATFRNVTTVRKLAAKYS